MSTRKKTKNPLEKLNINFKSKFAKNLALVLLVGTVSFFLASKYKNQFIVATVNYQPVSRFQLNRLLNERYGQMVLDELISQTLIKSLIKENNIEVTEADIEEEIANLDHAYRRYLRPLCCRRLVARVHWCPVERVGVLGSHRQRR